MFDEEVTGGLLGVPDGLACSANLLNFALQLTGGDAGHGCSHRIELTLNCDAVQGQSEWSEAHAQQRRQHAIDALSLRTGSRLLRGEPRRESSPSYPRRSRAGHPDRGSNRRPALKHCAHRGRRDARICRHRSFRETPP